MSFIWLIRHGQASFGSSDYDRLSVTGDRQSHLAGRYFRDTGLIFERIITGTMKRQIDTADHILAAMNKKDSPEIVSAFDEYNFLSIIKSQLPGLMEEDPEVEDALEGIFDNNENFQRFFGKIMKRWISGRYDADGVETFEEYRARVRDGLFGIGDECGPGSSVGIVTSGGVISIAMQLALGLNDHEAMRLGWRIMNASVSKFKYSRGRLNLIMFNQLSHLEYEKDENLMTYR